MHVVTAQRAPHERHGWPTVQHCPKLNGLGHLSNTITSLPIPPSASGWCRDNGCDVVFFYSFLWKLGPPYITKGPFSSRGPTEFFAFAGMQDWLEYFCCCIRTLPCLIGTWHRVSSCARHNENWLKKKMAQPANRREMAKVVAYAKRMKARDPSILARWAADGDCAKLNMVADCHESLSRRPLKCISDSPVHLQRSRLHRHPVDKPSDRNNGGAGDYIHLPIHGIRAAWRSNLERQRFQDGCHLGNELGQRLATDDDSTGEVVSPSPKRHRDSKRIW